MITERIRNLRQQSIDAPATLSAERAQLITRLYQSSRLAGESVPVQRARVFQHILENKQICINPVELIV